MVEGELPAGIEQAQFRAVVGGISGNDQVEMRLHDGIGFLDLEQRENMGGRGASAKAGDAIV